MSSQLSTLASSFYRRAVATPAATGPGAEDEEFYSSWSLFLVCLLLILSLWTSYYLQIKRIRAVHETTVSIFAGMFVGMIIRLAPGTMIREMLTFKHTLFFNLLLPPIILNSGYELKQENFFRHFGSIIVFAFFGTFISAVGVGVIVHIYSMLGIESMNLSLVEGLTFGSTLSATDPVTILAIFNQYKVDPKLYTIIFGESLLNDAVSIVMYETLRKFHGTEVYISSIFHGVGIFLLSFSISMFLGVAFGLAMSLLLKHSHLNHFPHIESCLVALSAYICYFLSTGLTLSGIVSLLFCGITLKHYAYHTMSRRTQRGSKALFGTLAHLSENFIFIYLGMALFTSAPVSEPVFSYVKPLFILITTVAVVFTRYAAVFPLSEAINFVARHALGQRQEVLPHSYQMMLFWAGLRGAVGVALASGFNGPNAKVLRMTVLLVVVITVLFFGGTTARMLEVLKIKTNVADDEGGDSDDDEYTPFGVSHNLFNGNSWMGGSGRANGPGAAGWNRWNDLEEWTAIPRGGAGRIGSHYGNQRRSNDYAHRNGSVPASPTANQALFSSASSESYDSDAEVLPLAPNARHEQRSHRQADNLNASTSGTNLDLEGQQPQGTTTTTSDDNKWFQAIDERYLLPIFSNATASRTFNARKTARKQAAHANALMIESAVGSQIGLNDVGEGSGSRSRDDSEIDLGAPGRSDDMQASGSGGRLNTKASAPTRLNLSTSDSADLSQTERGLRSPSVRHGADPR